MTLIAAQQPIIKRMIKALGDVFVPILPAIVASGLMMGLVEAKPNRCQTGMSATFIDPTDQALIKLG